MNIVIVIDSLAGGGAEKVMLTLAQQLVKTHSVTILSLANKYEYTIPANIKVESLFSDKATKVDRFWKINKSVAKLEAWFNNKQKQYIKN